MKVWRVISQVRTVTAWLVIAAFVSMMLAEDQIRGYPRPWPGGRPNAGGIAVVYLVAQRKPPGCTRFPLFQFRGGSRWLYLLV